MHDAVQQRMRQATNETASEHPENRDFASRARTTAHEGREASWEGDRGRADDDEETKGGDQPGGRGADERVDETA